MALAIRIHTAPESPLGKVSSNLPCGWLLASLGSLQGQLAVFSSLFCPVFCRLFHLCSELLLSGAFQFPAHCLLLPWLPVPLLSTAAAKAMSVANSARGWLVPLHVTGSAHSTYNKHQRKEKGSPPWRFLLIRPNIATPRGLGVGRWHRRILSDWLPKN